ncbi:CDP-diacylglycerol--serine O-phosphatidyltransferase [Parendozoicomonas sp. Alg238-R29]|uniref:CDP-diacylglycerol--serine O-phosphatidyltransferase n=1 Tax=Parendozoicomonas sp. Alg238-R29 TaxID=2993446 RepID=UPI00248F2D06|nr:CDP-diacylglycerol--serine O-phosphatidyltransferase [Parendozoicomonas sp. Alg238-R29]
MFAPAYYRERLNNLPQVAVAATDYRIITSTRGFKERLLELIRTATQRIYLTALYLEADDAGEEILRALFEARQANPALDIQIFVDFHRAQRGRIGEEAAQTNRDFYKRITAEYEYPIGIHGVPVKNREVFGVLHLKGFVFDDTILYSGASINDVYLHQDNRYRYDRYHEIHSPALSDSFVGFIDTYFCKHPAVQRLNFDGQFLRRKLKLSVRRFRKTMRNAVYNFTPQAGEGPVGLTPVCGIGPRGNRLNSMIRDLIRSAEKEVFICTPYFNLPRAVSKDINQLLKRGVKVTIVVGDKTANDFYIPPEESFSTIGGLPYLYEDSLRSFARKHQSDISSGLLNLMLWKDNDNSYHLKGLYVDDELAMITGSNLNPRAWGLDLENGILVQDREHKLRDAFQNEQERIFANATRIDNYRQIQKVSDYPDEVQRLIGRLRKMKAHVLLRKII